MQTENPHLSEEQARHLTIHGSNQNEDGTFSWKFDNYVRNFSLLGPHEDITKIYGNITSLVRGLESGHRTRWPMDTPFNCPVEGSPLPTLDTGCTTIN